MAAEAAAHGPDLVSVVVLLAAGVIAVPIFKRAGLGSILGYLAAGLVIGPFGLGFFSDPATILHVAELGVVMGSRPDAIETLSADQLKKNVASARRLRDKWRDLATEQRRETQQAQKSRVTDKNARSGEKAALFAHVLKRYEDQLKRVEASGATGGVTLAKPPKKVLVIGASTGYGLASRIVPAFGGGAATVGVFFEKPGEEGRTGSAGWNGRDCMRIAIVTHSLLVSDVLANILREQSDLEVTAVSDDVGQVYELAGRVDMLLLHHLLPHPGALKLVRVVERDAPDTCTIIIGAPDEQSEEAVGVFLAALQNGDEETARGLLCAEELAGGDLPAEYRPALPAEVVGSTESELAGAPAYAVEVRGADGGTTTYTVINQDGPHLCGVVSGN